MLSLSHSSPLLGFVLRHPSLPILCVLLVFLVFRWITVRRDKEKVEYLLGVCLLVSPVCYFLLRKVLAKLTELCPLKYDLYAYEFGTWFGSPSWSLRLFALQHPRLHSVAAFTYDSIYLVIIGTLAVYLWNATKAEANALLKTFALNLVMAPILYILIPIAGPRYAFPGFPMSPGEISVQPIFIAAAPKGIPALHLTMALIAFWYLRKWWWGRVAGGVYALLMATAVMVNGEHYFLDVLCSVPFTAMLIYFGTPRTQESDEASRAKHLDRIIAWRGNGLTEERG